MLIVSLSAYLTRMSEPRESKTRLRRVVSLNTRDPRLSRGTRVPRFNSKSKKKRVGEEVGLEEVTIRNRDENYPRMKEAEAGEERNE